MIKEPLLLFDSLHNSMDCLQRTYTKNVIDEYIQLNKQYEPNKIGSLKEILLEI